VGAEGREEVGEEWSVGGHGGDGWRRRCPQEVLFTRWPFFIYTDGPIRWYLPAVFRLCPAVFLDLRKTGVRWSGSVGG